jgi:Delta7-sterol 5-desaturase
MQQIIENFAQHYGILPTWLLMSLGIFLRYLIPAGIAYSIFYVWKRRSLWRIKIQQKLPENEDLRRELGHSLMTAGIFAAMAFGVFFLRQAGYGQMYFDINEHSWGYYFFSIAAAVFLHDTYFYWIHRLMHHPRLFKIFHRVHHQSHNPTPFTSFSFHPLEAVVEFGIIPFFALVIPMHPTALLIVTAWSILLNVFGHTGYELAPSGFTKHWLFKWFNTPTHHNMHHSRSNANYSLYFNFWDRIMGTNHPEYDQYFEKVIHRTDDKSLEIM